MGGKRDEFIFSSLVKLIEKMKESLHYSDWHCQHQQMEQGRFFLQSGDNCHVCLKHSPYQKLTSFKQGEGCSLAGSSIVIFPTPFHFSCFWKGWQLANIQSLKCFSLIRELQHKLLLVSYGTVIQEAKIINLLVLVQMHLEEMFRNSNCTINPS